MIDSDDIDGAVANAMGWKFQKWSHAGAEVGHFWKRGNEERPTVPHYSRSMGWAWEVILEVRKWDVRDQLMFVMNLKVRAPLLEGGDERDKLMWFLMEADSADLICRAFLIARGAPR